MKIVYSLIIIFIVFCNTHYIYGVNIDPRMGGAVAIEMAGFMTKLAFEEEKENIRDWNIIRTDFYLFYEHSPLSFEEVLEILEASYLTRIINTPDYKTKLKDYEGLPFPAIWKLLDRKKPIRVYDLNRFSFRSSRPDPGNEVLAKKMLNILGSDDEKAQNEEIARRKDNKFLEDNVLRCIKLSLLKWLELSPKKCPDVWTDEMRKNAADRLQKMFAGTPDTAEKWYLKEGTRRALLAITEDKDIKDQIKTSVWETQEFLKWLKQAEKDYKLPSSEK